jgi:hypothetical protein
LQPWRKNCCEISGGFYLTHEKGIYIGYLKPRLSHYGSTKSQKLGNIYNPNFIYNLERNKIEGYLKGKITASATFICASLDVDATMIRGI